MQKLRITISNVLKYQLPSFVREDYPLVEQLFSEYYKSQECQGGVLDILQNIDKYVKLNNLTSLIDKTKTTSAIGYVDRTVQVESTAGFPDYYGLIQIDSEIILYKSKTATSFDGCVRGFSGINSYDKTLNFEKTTLTLHENNSVVKNLNILFLNQFLVKIKKQFAPGFENRKFFSKITTDPNTGKETTIKLNENIFIKQLKDFYSSKGTDISFKILFKALFDDDVEIIKPRDFLIIPSSAQYRVNKELVIEDIEGNPLDLVDTTIYQNALVIDGKDFISSAYGTVNKVQTITRSDKTYYVVALDYDYNKDINLKGSTYGEFVVGPKTLITDSASINSSVITVDSTYGFPEKNGILRIRYNDKVDCIVTYKTKNLNQFLGCDGVIRDITQGQELYLNYYCSGGNTVGADENPIKFRITGVLSEATTEPGSHYIVPENRINIRTLGKDIQNPAFNNWKFNIAPSYKVKSIIRNNVSNNTYRITLYDEHIFYAGDNARLLSSVPQLLPGAEDSGVSEFIANVESVEGKYSFTCSVNFQLDTTLTYEIERKINKFNFTYNSTVPETNNTYITDVQNVYRDSEGSLYVASQSLPSYENSSLTIKDETVTLSSNVYIGEEINLNNSELTDKILNIGRHPFKTGDAIYYQSGSGDNRLNILEGIYYVKSIGSANNSTQIKLSSSRTNIDNNVFLDISFKSTELTGNDNKIFKSTNELIYFQNSVKNFLTESKFERFISPKNIIKKISKPLASKEKQATSPGSIGILVNGVEILNYKSNSFIYYGSIEDIKIKSSGSNYDVANPPKLTITDKVGLGVSAICHITGSLSRIDVLDGGFDYETTPLIQIIGGNGSGAEATSNLILFDYSVSFNAKPDTQIDLNTYTILFNKKHKFYDGEQVKYSYTQIPIEGLQKDVVYYIGCESDYSIKLYGNYNDSVNKSNPIAFLFYAGGTHTLTSVQKKNTIGSINIAKSGNGYSNRKTIALSKDINIFSNIITIPSHGYQTGERLTYSTNGTPIVGLETTSEYLVYKVDNNQFKLCEINSDANDKNFYLYTEQFIDLIDSGSGKHIFNYPTIEVKIVGAFKNKRLDISEVQSTIAPAFRGSITSIFIEEGGVGYGSSEILNYNRQPNFVLENGIGAELRPIISNGRISEVLIVNSGNQYTAIPEIQVIGTGTGAKLLPIISEGKIVDVKIVSAGINYDANTTILNIISSGSGANFEFSIQNWNLNQVERLIQNKSFLGDDVILNDTKNEYNERMTQITHSYAPKKLRENFIVSREENGQIYYKKDLTFDTDGVESSTSNTHSPIIGWAYDGNPIYGPFGFENPDGTGMIKRMKSGYILSANKPNRPNSNIFPRGIFVEDYVYIQNGDLDESNGRFCATPEFPNGVYAYFATVGDIDSNFSRKYSRPVFPYLIGNYYKSSLIEYNFDNDESQNSINFQKLNFLRNTTPYNLLSKNSSYNYVFNPIKYEKQLNKISRVGNGKIDNITIVSGGENYKVGDKITLSEDEFGYKSYAEVTKVKGVGISSISSYVQTSEVRINDVEFGSFNVSDVIIGITSEPHQLKDKDIISCVGLNEIITNEQKNVSTKVEVSVNQLVLTKNIKSTSETGEIVKICVDGNLKESVIEPNDVYYIEEFYEDEFGESQSRTEEVKVLNVDRTDSTIRVKRQVGFGTHYRGSVLVENPRKFKIKVDERSDKSNKDDDKIKNNFEKDHYPVNTEIYFNPSDSVGLGTVGVTSSVLFNILPLNFQVAINTNAKVAIANSTETITRTGIVFEVSQQASQFKVGDYISLEGSSNFEFDAIQKVKVLNVGISSIIVDYDSSSLNGEGVVSFVTKWKTRQVPIRSIYLPSHGLESGDKVKYSRNNGSSLGISTDKVNTEQLVDNDVLHVHKFDDDHIGIAKTIVGLTTTGEYLNESTGDSLLYLTSPGAGVYHSFKTERNNVQVGTVVKHVARVSTIKNNSLFFNDDVKVIVKPKLIRTIIIKYNKENRRLVVDPKSFDSINSDSSITIVNHQYSTGDKVVHTTPDLISNLINNKIYFVVVIDDNNIRLATSYYNAIQFNPTTVNITTNSIGELSLVNPHIKVYKNEIIKFDLKDRSLSFINNETFYSAFKFLIYKDKNFTDQYIKAEEDTFFSVKRIGRIGISNNASVEFKVSDETPLKLFYRFELDNIDYNIPQEQLEYLIDTENIADNSTIFILDSLYDGKHKVYNAGNNFFEYLLEKKPERSIYSLTDAELSYTTNSYSTLGEIDEVQVLSKDRKYRVLPGITSIISETGTGAILFPYSEEIGSAKKVKIENIGFDYSSDYSLRPTGNLPQIIQVEPLSIFKEIKVTSVGKNYTNIPKLIVLDGLTEIQDKQVELKFVPEDSIVEIIQNSSGLYNKIPYIVPINNSNGITVRSVSFNPDNKFLTLNLNVSFSRVEDFPFEVGNKILLENFKVSTIFINENGEFETTTNVRGINSENYGYALFDIDSLTKGIGGYGSITIDMTPYLTGDEIPGVYSPVNSLGYVVPQKYFPTFDITLQKNNFILGEEVVTTSGYNGIVEYWDRENEFVSVLSDDKFVTGDRITGKTSNLSGIVGKVEFFNAEYSTNSNSVVQRGWDTRTGFLNDNNQRIQDSDYYQYFSYALKSKTQISKWDDVVSSLNHTAGFKKFATLEVESLTPQSEPITVSYSETNAVSDLFEVVDLNSYHDFDMVSENSFTLSNRLVSDQVIFNTKEIQDYSESVNNRVLMIDDFSSQFNNLPRAERYSIIDRFPIYQSRHKKYFAYVKDKLFYNERQLSVISLIHDNLNGYVNQYGRLETVNELGNFDFVINGDEGQVQFKPFDYEYNDFDVDLVSYSLFDTFVGIANTYTTDYFIGDIVKFSNEVNTLPSNSTLPLNIARIPLEYRSSKIILTLNSQNGIYRESSELNIIHDGTNVYISEYGKLFTEVINPPVGFATYNAYINGPELYVDIVPYVGYGSTVEINALELSIRDNTGTIPDVVSQNNLRLESAFINISATSSPTELLLHSYSYNYGGGYYYISIQDSTFQTFHSLELLTLNNDIEVYNTQFGSVITDTSLNPLVGLGTFGSRIIGTKVYVYFTPIKNRNIDIRFFYNGIKTIAEIDPDTPETEAIVDLNQAQIVSFSSDYIGTENAIKRSFELYHKNRRIMKRTFRGNSSKSVDLFNDRIVIPNHYFSTGEEITYDFGGDEPIGIGTTSIPGIGVTDKLPSTLYAIKLNDLSVRVAASASESLKAFPEYLKLSSYGVGSLHSFTGKRGNSRSLITIDNMIQSPIVSGSTTTRLVSDVALKDIRIKVEDPSAFVGGDIFKVDNEIIRVRIVGFGSTNTLLVNRYWMGTTPTGIHSAGKVCTIIKGSYNIVNNTIHFYDPPYGKIPVIPENPRWDEIDYVGITTNSSFSGRIFNKSGVTNTSLPTYSDNILLDDISEQFTGLATVFTLKENEVPVSGISTSNLIVLVKDILQIPNNELRTNNGAFELGQNLSNETTIVFNQENQPTNLNNIDINATNVPSGGIILSVGSTFGSGYQTLKSAKGTAIVNNSGVITSISVGSNGSGYRVTGKPKEILVSTASTVAIGTDIIPILESRGLFDKLEYSTNQTCNIGIGTNLHSVSILSYSSLSSTIKISKNTDVIIPQSTKISISISGLTRELVDIEARMENNGVYENHYIGFATVTNGSISSNLTLINPGISFTSFYSKFETILTSTTTSGSTRFYISETSNIVEDYDYVSINNLNPLKIVNITDTFIETESSYASNVSSGSNVKILRYTPPEIVFDSPLGYYNIPLVYSSSSSSSGIGTDAAINVTVGEEGNVIDYNIENNGYGYKKGDVLTVLTGGLTGIPVDSSETFEEFKIFVDRVYYTKFASWSIGDLQVIDSFDGLFDGNRKTFPIKINQIARSIRAKKGSSLDIQATLIVMFNDILQVPGQGYIFKGGSVIYFPEAPKYGDKVSIIFYRGNEEVDVIDVDVLETVKIGDELRIVSDEKKFTQNERIVTDIVSSDYANTNPYLGRGIDGDFNLLRPVIWSKQNVDLVIDGVNVGKDRIYYESSIHPSTRIIQDIGVGSTEIYVESLKTFFDNNAENIIDKDKFVIKIMDQINTKAAIATCRVSSAGTIFDINLIDGGYGYKNPPIVSIQNASSVVGSSYSMTVTSIVDSLGISTTGLSSAILGEEIIGTQSDTIARLSGISTDNVTIFYISLNSLNFIQNEEIRFETSGLSGEASTISGLNTPIAEASITSGIVTQISLTNVGYGYTYGPIANLKVVSDGSGYPDTLNPSNNIFYNARIKSVSGNGINATANIIINDNPITLSYSADFEVTNDGSNYSVGDILKVDTFDNVAIGATNRNKILTLPILFEVTEIKPPVVSISSPTPDVEIIKNVSFTGDFGVIVGVGTTVVGISSNALVFDLYIPKNSYLRNNIIIGDTAVGSAITISQLEENDYFVINGSNVGDGVVSLRNDSSVIGVSSATDHIDNVYQVFSSEIIEKDLYSSGIGTVYVNKITALVNSFGSIPSSYDLICGNYSWGKIGGLSNRLAPKEFKTYQDLNINVGLGTIGINPIVQRFNSLRYVGYTTVL